MPRKVSVGVKAAIIVTVGTVVAALIGLVSTEKPAEPFSPTQKVDGADSQLRLPMALDSRCFPSGWMGDGQTGKTYLTLEHVRADVNGSVKTAIRFDYKAGPTGWAGLYWQCPDGNWGTVKGIPLLGARAITFVARGDKGGEIVEFKAGGTRGAFPDSFEVSLGKISLAPTWTEYRLDLTGRDLSNVAGAFAWSAPAPPTGRLSFYVADIQVQ